MANRPKPLYGGVLNAPVFKTHTGKPFMICATPLPGALKRGLGPRPYRASGRVFERRRVQVFPTSPYPLTKGSAVCYARSISRCTSANTVCSNASRNVSPR